MARSNKHFEAEKHKLVVEMESIFMDKGYEHTTLEDILMALDMSKGRFYHYFKSKEEVIFQCMHLLSEKLIEVAEIILQDKNLNAVEKLLRFIEFREASFLNKEAILKAYQMICASDTQKEHFIGILGKAYVAPFSKLIEEGVRDGYFDVTFPYETARLLLSALLAVPILPFDAINSEEDMDHKAYKSATFDLVARTLGVNLDAVTLNALKSVL